MEGVQSRNPEMVRRGSKVWQRCSTRLEHSRPRQADAGACLRSGRTTSTSPASLRSLRRSLHESPGQECCVMLLPGAGFDVCAKRLPWQRTCGATANRDALRL